MKPNSPDTDPDSLWEEMCRALHGPVGSGAPTGDDDPALVTASSLLAEEAALRDLERAGDVVPLSATEVERLVALATKPAAPFRRTGMFARRMLMAALLTVSLASLAFVGARLWWREIDPGHTLDFTDAVAVAMEPGRFDSARVSALGRIAEHCDYAAGVLGRLRQPGGPQALAAEAAAVAEDGARRLAAGVGSGAPPMTPESDLVATVDRLLDTGRPERDRLAALHDLRDLLFSGIAAMLQSPLQGNEAEQQRAIWIDRLAKRLSGSLR